MGTKYTLLLKISWYIGLIALVGGWSIFLIWVLGRFAWAVDIESFEYFGFFWMVVFFWLSLLAIVFLLAYVLINRKNLHLKMLFTGLLLLVNIPSVLIILRWQGDVESRVFVSLANQSGRENIDLNLLGKLKSWDIGSIDNGSSKVFNYNPPYTVGDDRQYQTPDSLKLIVTQNGVSDTIDFPTLNMGDCVQLVIDNELKVKSP